jgi:hypothetical protein
MCSQKSGCTVSYNAKEGATKCFVVDPMFCIFSGVNSFIKDATSKKQGGKW